MTDNAVKEIIMEYEDKLAKMETQLGNNHYLADLESQVNMLRMERD
jgi:hypothetical protein